LEAYDPEPASFQGEKSMETTNGLITTPAAAGGSSCHSAGQSSGSWLGRWRGLAIAGVVIAAGTSLALSQHWLAVASLVPLLYVLPCAAMMFMCMKGMNHGQQTGANQASAPADTPTGADTRN
jgi:hypothetical protein